MLEAADRVGGRNWAVRGGTTSTDLDGREQTARFGEGQYLNPVPRAWRRRTSRSTTAAISGAGRAVRRPERQRGSGEYALLNEPAGRLHSAGDRLSYFSGWQAGAMDSARHVVQSLHGRVGAEG